MILLKNINYIKDVVEQKYTAEAAKKDYLACVKQKFVLFWGHHTSVDGSITKSCLSQWYESPFEVDGIKYSCAEQFMMASKAQLFGDSEILEKILRSNDQETIKALGREVRGFNSDIWDEHKFTIVFYGNLMKFSQNEDLRRYLLSTDGKILAEASPYDGIWGIKLSSDDEGAMKPVKWKGENLLGFALMQVRDELL
ncbi:MAG: NADAR family protein [Ruminococcus sp.]|nr:NADAR family protein [Ruminococcus sp.]